MPASEMERSGIERPCVSRRATAERNRAACGESRNACLAAAGERLQT